MGFSSGDEHPFSTNLGIIHRRIHCCIDTGTLTVSGAIWRDENSRRKIEMTCSECEQEFEIHVEAVLRRQTTNCRCQRRRKYSDPRARVLGERFDAIKQRCKPGGHCSRNYGDIGIECHFEREQFIHYCLEHLPHRDYLGVEIDRIDNYGHYQKGNLRLSTKAENLRNRSSTKYYLYKGKLIAACDLWHFLREDYPDFDLSSSHTAKLARAGIDLEDILSRKARRRSFI